MREAEVQERDGNGDDVVSENIDLSANNNIQESGEWSCSMCTYRNRPDSLSCDCGTPRFPNRVPGVNFFDLTRAVDDDSLLNPRYPQGNVRERPSTPIPLDRVNVQVFEEGLGTCMFCQDPIKNDDSFVQCSCPCRPFHHKNCYEEYLARGKTTCIFCRTDLLR